VDSLGVLLDYHCCPFCGCEQFIDVPSDESGVGISDRRDPDRACEACGIAVFVDPMLIWPRRTRPLRRSDVA
jgi:hypothetical protein